MSPFAAPSIDGKPPEPLKPGMKLFGNRFELVRSLGAGGMGVVWLARDTLEDCLCALKFLLQVFVQDEREMEKLRDQVRRGKELRHPRLVATYGLEAEGPYAAVLMEYVDGQTLGQKLESSKRGFFEAKDIQNWVKDLCVALDVIHREMGWAHRDIKPANVMIDKEGRARLMDFGISQRIAQTISRLSRVEEKPATGSSGSTLPYASPQQIDSKPAKPADDIYSLGAMIFELLTGRPPFLGSDLALLTTQILNTQPPTMAERRQELVEDEAISSTGEEIPAIWETVVAKCLEKRPSDRPPSATLLWQWLESGDIGTAEAAGPTLKKEPPQDVPSTSRTMPVSGADVRRPGVNPALAAALVAVLGLMGWGWWNSHNQKPAQPLPADHGPRVVETNVSPPPATAQNPQAIAQREADQREKARLEAELAQVKQQAQLAEQARMTAEAEKAAYLAKAKKDAQAAADAKAEEQRLRAVAAMNQEIEQNKEAERLRLQKEDRESSLRSFMQDHMKSYQSNDPDVWAGMFAPYSQYKYYEGPGQAPRSFVSKDRESYIRDYPDRTFQVLNGGKYTYTFRGDTTAEISYSYSYVVRGSKTRSGSTTIDITVEKSGNSWQITKYDEHVNRH